MRIMGWTLTFLMCLVVAVHGLPQSDLHDIIDDIFPTGYMSPQTHNQTNSRSTQDEVRNTACTQENGQPGECVQYFLCNVNSNSIITDGKSTIDIRRKRKKREIINEGTQCDDYIDVCCGSSDIGAVPILLPSAVPGSGSGDSIGGSSGSNLGSGGDNNRGEGGRYEYNGIRGCGQRNPDGIGFRIKGDTDNEAVFGEFPWMVAILREEPVAASGQKQNLYICGGTLIHPKVVMTVAHCVVVKTGMPKLKIRAGDWDTQTEREILPHQDRYVVQIMSHEQYNKDYLHNDIALLILESPVTYAENIGIVCLPPENEEPPLNAMCYSSGWGKDVFGKEGKYQAILKRISSTIIPRNKCQADLRKTRLGNKFMLHRTFICANGEKETDTCRGDGGSPLVCPMPGYPDKFMQSGIVTWGISCGKRKTPGVYVHIASLRSWIDDQLHFNNINDMNLYAP